jgi:hypothetical protein
MGARQQRDTKTALELLTEQIHTVWAKGTGTKPWIASTLSNCGSEVHEWRMTHCHMHYSELFVNRSIELVDITDRLVWLVLAYELFSQLLVSCLGSSFRIIFKEEVTGRNPHPRHPSRLPLL